jgi:hypothetical protein
MLIRSSDVKLRQHFVIDIVVPKCRRILFKPQPAQQRHYVHAAILGSEERQPLIKEDIPPPFGLPAAALKYAPCRVSRLQAANDCFQAWASLPGKSGMSPFHPLLPFSS